MNNDVFLDYTAKTHAKFGKALIFLDNVRYHKFCAVKEGMEKFGDVILECPLSYAPETGPSEGQWKIKNNILSAEVVKSL